MRCQQLIVIAGLAAVAAAPGCGGKTGLPLTPAKPGPAPPALPSDFLVHDVTRFENTAKVVPPGGNPSCPRGAIAVATGQARPGELITRTLTNPDGTIDTTTIGTATPYPFDAALEAMATDNQMIRLADGSLLAMKNGYRWDPISPQPDWWDAFAFDGSTWASYARNSIYFWRSTDCGASWTRASHIDPAAVAGGKYAWPQPVDDDDDDVQDVDPSGKPKVGIGGFDRTEVYQDPWTARIYVSGHGDGGPFGNGDTKEDHHKEVIFSGTQDGGWTVMKELDFPGKGNAPFVMTSTPNGRFYAFSCTGGTPTLFYTNKVGDPTSLNDGLPLLVEGGVCGNDGGTPISRSIMQPSISRVSLDASSSVVRIAFPVLNDHGRQMYLVVNAEVDDANPALPPTVTHVGTVVGEDPATRSILYASFIDPDYVDDESPTNDAVLYWIETSSNGQPVEICAKYQMYSGTSSAPTEEAYLSRTGGAPRCWSDATAIGDYMSGGFFRVNGKPSYFAQWVEADGIHGNVITPATISAP